MNGKLNGAGEKFDKMMRSDALRKDDDALRTLRKLAPAIAKTVDEIDATFAALLDKLGKIEATHEAWPCRGDASAGARADRPTSVLQAMQLMTPDARAGADDQAQTVGGLHDRSQRRIPRDLALHGRQPAAA